MKCGLCGEPMPPGEEMFKYHGYSGACPKPPLTAAAAPAPEDRAPDGHKRTCPASGNYQPPYEECDCGAGAAVTPKALDCSAKLVETVAALNRANDATTREEQRADRAEQVLREMATLAREAVNGWACHARRKIEHADIARLHAAIDAVLARQAAPAPEGLDALKLEAQLIAIIKGDLLPPDAHENIRRVAVMVDSLRRDCEATHAALDSTLRARPALSDEVLLRRVLEELVIDANRLCDRNQGGTYEEDCRRSIAKARAVLARQQEAK